jgi:hypothetical protein
VQHEIAEATKPMAAAKGAHQIRTPGGRYFGRGVTDEEGYTFRTWAIPASLIVLAEYATALAIGRFAGFPYFIPFKSYAIAGLTVATLGLFCIIAIRLIRRDFAKPLPFGFVTATILVALQWAVVMWLKVMLPLTVGFWADPMLARADAALFLGAEPWRLAHALLWWADGFIDRAYVSWAPVKFALLVGLVLAPETRAKAVALISYFLYGAISVTVQYATPSAGPVFYEAIGHGPRFAELPIAPWVSTEVSYLWSAYLNAGGKPGGGISAMPSVHVAASLWMALVVRAFTPRLQAFGWAYFSLILIGSVYLGWHYALDGIAGVIIALAAWRLAQALVARAARA